MAGECAKEKKVITIEEHPFRGKIALAIYLGILALFKEFTKEDFWFYLDTFNIRKMLVYIRDELKGK